MTEQQLEHMETMIGEDIDKKALEMVNEILTPGENNKRLEALMLKVRPEREALLEAVEKSYSIVVGEMMRWASEGFTVFYKEGFYNGIEFTDSIYEEADRQEET